MRRGSTAALGALRHHRAFATPASWSTRTFERIADVDQLRPRRGDRFRRPCARHFAAPLDPPTDSDMRAALDDEFDKLGTSLSEDLAIAAQRSQSVRATRAAESVKRAVDAWKGICERLLDGTKARRQLGDARPIHDQGRRPDRSPGELHRRRRLPVPAKARRAAVAHDIQLNIAASRWRSCSPRWSPGPWRGASSVP